MMARISEAWFRPLEVLLNVGIHSIDVEIKIGSRSVPWASVIPAGMKTSIADRIWDDIENS